MADSIKKGESLKAEGNTFYGDGKKDEALAKYTESQNVLEKALKGDCAQGDLKTQCSELLASVYNNAAQIYFEQENFEASGDASRRAAVLWPSWPKAHFRFARALINDGFKFEAFLTMFGPLKSLFLSMPKNKVAEFKDVRTGIDALEGPLLLDLGLKDVDTNLIIEPYEGGVETRVTMDRSAGKILFIEREMPAFDDTMKLPPLETATTESLVEFFANELGQMIEKSPQGWDKVRRQMRGSWPRRFEEVPQKMLDKFQAKINDQWSDLSDTQRKELLLLALQCRYNRFYSGFFRVCALINHSCSPNAAMKYNPASKEVGLLVVSTVKRGEALTVKYLDDFEYFAGVGQRRQLLHFSWLFWCNCSRCATELDPSCTAEHIKCSTQGCNSYVYCPGPRSRVGGDPEALPQDPALADETKFKCAACGNVRRWSEDERQIIYQIQDEIPKYLNTTFDQLIRFVQSAQSRARSLVHNDHWIYRQLLNVFCLGASGYVQRIFDAVVAPPDGLTAMVGEPLHIEGEEPPGGFTMFLFMDIWRRIKSFYPDSQGWLIHATVLRCVTAGLILQYNNITPLIYRGTPFRPITRLEAREAMAIHGKQMLEKERASMLKLVTMRCGTSVPQADQKELKKLFQ